MSGMRLNTKSATLSEASRPTIACTFEATGAVSRLTISPARRPTPTTLMGPSALGLAVNQVNVLVNSMIALHWVGTWAPSALFYAERLIYLPQGILATALGTVLLPVLSDFAAQKKHLEMREAIHHGLRTLLFVMTPAAAARAKPRTSR